MRYLEPRWRDVPHLHLHPPDSGLGAGDSGVGSGLKAAEEAGEVVMEEEEAAEEAEEEAVAEEAEAEGRLEAARAFARVALSAEQVPYSLQPYPYP